MIRKNIAANIAVFLLALFISLFFAEFALRLVFPSANKNELRTLEYRHDWILNKEGFRDDDFDLKLQKKSKNIILLGDSFLVGVGVGKNKRFSDLLAEKFGSRIETFNLGKCSTGTIQQTEILTKYIDRIKPKAVVLFFYWNDINDNFQVLNRRKSIRSEEPTAVEKQLNRLRVYQISRYLYGISLRKLNLWPIYYDIGLELLRKDGSISREAELGWEYTHNALLKMQSICQDRSTAFYVVYLPSSQQLGHWSGVLRFENADPEKYDRFMLDKRLKLFCDSNRIEFVDLAPELDSLRNKNSLYYYIDLHFNEAGHLAVYQRMLPYFDRWLRSV